METKELLEIAREREEQDLGKKMQSREKKEVGGGVI